MITANGWYAGGMEGRGCEMEGLSVQPIGEMGKDFCPNFLNPFLENTVTTEAGSLFQYFTTLIENANPLLWRWLAPLRTL